MAKLSVNSEVTKEAYELGQGIKNFTAELKKALADGWQWGTDMPVALQAAFQHLIPGIEGADKMDDEAKEDLEAFSTGLLLSAKEIAFLFVKKEEVPSEDGE